MISARTDRFVAGASSDISEEMIKSSFFECFQVMMFLHYFSITTSSVFCFLFSFFFSPKLGYVLCTGAHYKRVNTVCQMLSFASITAA